MFALRQIYKDEGNELLQKLVKLIMNSLYGVQIRKDIIESYNHNMGWKRNTMIMCQNFGDYQMEII